MNYLDGYVEEVLSEPYYDDYGSGIFRWWVEAGCLSLWWKTYRADGTALDAVEEKCISISKGKALLYQITAGAKVMFRMHLRI